MYKTNEIYSISNESEFVNVLYKDPPPKNLIVGNQDLVSEFVHWCHYFDLPCDIDFINSDNFIEYIQICVNSWNMPEDYKKFDIESFIMNKCKTDEEISRVKIELNEFKSRNMITLLKFLKFFVDEVEKNDIMLGVGRGSSVSSYVLYLLGIHKVDSLKYDIPITDFFK